MRKSFVKILLITLASTAIGGLLAFLFYYFFKGAAVYFIEKFKFIQSIFGIKQYEQGMSVSYVFVAIFFGNLVSTAGYFGLGYIRASVPMGFITGFLVIALLFTGIIRNAQSIPQDVIILISAETIYRVLALSLGEYIGKNKKKSLPWVVLIIIIGLFLFGVFFEIYSIFGSFF